MKKKVYMWQPYYIYGDNPYLPYSVGSIAAYAWADEDISREYELCGLFYLRIPIEAMLKSLESPFLCAFSCYVWNIEYNIKLATAIKSKFPDCYIVFGGHQISRETIAEISKVHGGGTYVVDSFVFDEGEFAFRDILSALSRGEPFNAIDNICYRKDEELVFTKRSVIDGAAFPSPYLSGLFEDIISEHPEYRFSAVIETNRGCPYGCAYCDWGYHKGKMRMFPMERVKAEIDYCVSHHIEYIYCADSNFGIYERDEEIVDYLVEQHQKYGYPHKFRATFAKNTTERVFRINKKLNDNGMSKGATLSFQSLNPQTLDVIGRKNIKVSYFKELLARYTKEGISTYSEIIMGLPKETVDTFRKGISDLLKGGQHKSINIYACELLTNSSMGQPEFVKKYEIDTIRTPIPQIYTTPDCNDIQEYDRYVVSTSSLSREDWKKCYIYAWAIQCFHSLGLTRYIAIYLYQEHGIEYDMFYTMLLDYFALHPDTIAGKCLKDTIEKLESAMNDDGVSLTYYNPLFGDVPWPLEEGCYLEILANLSKFYEQIRGFVAGIHELDKEILDDLIEYQYIAIKQLVCKKKEVRLRNDFFDYFYDEQIVGQKILKKQPVIVSVRNADCFESWEQFAKEVIWYGRKNGATQYELEAAIVFEYGTGEK